MAFAIVMSVVSLLPVGQWLEREVGLPLLYSVRGDRPVPPGAIVIGLDNPSVSWLNRLSVTMRSNPQDIPLKSPLLAECLPEETLHSLLGAANINHIPRALHACLLHELTKRRARVVAFDINFNTERPGDDVFRDAIAKAGNALLFERIRLGENGDLQRIQPRVMFQKAALGTMAFRVDSARGEMATSYLTTFGTVGPLRELRAMPDKVWEVFSGQKITPPATEFQPIWLYGPPESVKTIPIAAIFNPAAEERLPDDLSDMAVFIGSSDPNDANIDDHFPVPNSGRGSQLIGGVELAATAFLNRLHGEMPSRTPVLVDLAIVFGIALLGSAAVLTLSGWPLLAMIVLLSAGYFMFAAAMFSVSQIWMPVAVPVFLTALPIILGGLTVRYFFVRALVTRLAPRQIANSLLSGNVAARRAVTTERATIMFTDLMGSTAMAERLSELSYTDAVNLYYDSATEVIEAHGGMVIEFLGDGIVSMFSQSVSGPDHAARTVSAACALIERLRIENASQPSDRTLTLRIGINTGLTATGDIGARHRFNYKALGDVVNVAARLESMARNYQHDTEPIILISETTLAEANLPPSAIEDLGVAEIRGRDEPLAIARVHV